MNLKHINNKNGQPYLGMNNRQTLMHKHLHMKKSSLFLLVVFPSLLFSQDSIDYRIDHLVSPIVSFIHKYVFFDIPIGEYKIPFVVIWLVVGATIFTIYMSFVNLRGFRHALDVVRGRFDNPNDPGEVSHFQALATALSATIGLGNIAGVAAAISIGGPGATFWMITAGFLGMSTKFVECTLGLKYREKHEDGSVSGGPMYYISKGLTKQNKKQLGKFLAAFFAISCIGTSFSAGNMFHINQATKQLANVINTPFLHHNGWVFGLIMAIVIGLVIIGGIKSIAKVTAKLVPLMCGIYIVGALIVICWYFTDIPSAFAQIFQKAFTRDAAFGGIVGALIVGFTRAAFSNEAGMGSAPIAHSAAKTDEPIREGIVALIGPFIDTIIVCTITALVIIITGNIPAMTTKITSDSAIILTSKSFSSVMPWFPPILSLVVILFALSSMISWSYYGLKSWTYLFGKTKTKENIYKIIFCIFIIIGSSISSQGVFDIADSLTFAMIFPNVLGLYFLMKEVKIDMKDYFKKLAAGEFKRYKL